MTQMVRKQIYLRRDQDARVKREARALGITEAELIRRRIDQGGPASPGPRDPEAWAAAMAFMKKRAEMDVPQTGRTWTRDELYEDD